MVFCQKRECKVTELNDWGPAEVFVGDSVTWLERPCECGNPLPAIQVEGRWDDTLIVHTDAGAAVKLLPRAVTTVLEEEAGVSQFQLIQVDRDRLILRLDTHNAEGVIVMRCREALERFLQSQHAAHVRIDIQTCSLPQHPVNGKRRRITMTLDRPHRRTIRLSADPHAAT